MRAAVVLVLGGNYESQEVRSYVTAVGYAADGWLPGLPRRSRCPDQVAELRLIRVRHHGQQRDRQPR